MFYVKTSLHNFSYFLVSKSYNKTYLSSSERKYGFCLGKVSLLKVLFSKVDVIRQVSFKSTVHCFVIRLTQNCTTLNRYFPYTKLI